MTFTTNNIPSKENLSDYVERLEKVLNTVIDGKGIIHSFNPSAVRIFEY